MFQLIVIHRNDFYVRPPVISVVELLVKNGVCPKLITTGINDYHRKWLDVSGVDYYIYPFSLSGNLLLNSIRSKLWGWRVRKLIRNKFYREDSVLWIEGNYTMYSIGTRFINSYPHILQIQELFDDRTINGKIYKRVLAKCMPSSLVNIVPEYNRANILRALFRLNRTPVVLPNKPSRILDKNTIDSLKGKFKDIIDLINNRKVILYQGILSEERNLENFVTACSTLPNDEYVTILLGKYNSLVDKYKSINPNLIHIPFIPAPGHLFITSLAYIGIVTYEASSLNLVYCAPNKIFEYGAYGIPMLCNDVPGLQYTVGASDSGVICDSSNTKSIIEGVEMIIKNYDTMSHNALNYYKSIDNDRIIKGVLEGLK